MTTDTLIEHVADWHAGLTVDAPNRIVHNVALTGLTSKNGYRYTEQALKTAAALYDHKPVFLDHAVDKSRPHERSTRDLVGTIVNPRFESDRIRGDIRVLDTESGRTFLALAESDAPGVGMSHVVLAQRGSADGSIEQIRDVVSVDAVVFPATTKTFRESVEAGSDEESVSASIEDEPTNELHTQLQQLLRERDELLHQLQSIRAREAEESREQDIDNEIQAAGLPSFAVTEEFRRQLLQSDEAGRTTLIHERRQLIETASRRPTSSAERTAASSPNTDAAFVSAIRRRAS